MKKIIIRLLAFLGLITILGSVTAIVAVLFFINKFEEPAEPSGKVVIYLDIRKSMVENNDPLDSIIHLLSGGDGNQSVHQIATSLYRAAEDDRVIGVVARIGATQQAVHVSEIKEALVKFKEKGKKTWVFATDLVDDGLNSHNLELASAFQNIWLQPAGSVTMTMPSSEQPFFQKALGKIGINSDVMKREDYKGAFESFTRESFSASVRENLLSIIKNINEQRITNISNDLGMTEQKLRSLMSLGLLTGSEAKKEGIITNIGGYHELVSTVDEVAGDGATWMTPHEYLSIKHKKTPTKSRVALIIADGVIAENNDGSEDAMGDNKIMDVASIVDALSQAEEDDSIKGVVIRVNSPGGEVPASETLRIAIERLRTANKPVVVSMGSMAASGGYWMISGADYIVASPTTITGSIGVIMGKPFIGKLSENIGITWDRLQPEKGNTFISITDKFTASERERINKSLDETYAIFLNNVSRGRRMSIEKTREIAGGRVFTGEQAQKIGLVDDIGGLNRAFQDIKPRLGISPSQKIEVVQLPGEDDAVKIITSLFEKMSPLGLGISPLTWRSIEKKIRTTSLKIRMRAEINDEFRYVIF